MGDEIRNDTEFLSAHWLEEGFPARRSALYTQWQAAHKGGRFDPLHAVASTAGEYLAAVQGDQNGAGRAARTEAHRTMVSALGLAPEDRPDLTIVRDGDVPLLQGDRALEVPALLSVSGASGLALLVLDARPVDDVENLLAEGALLVAPVRREDEHHKVTTIGPVAPAVSEILVADGAPRYVVVLAGRWALLTDAGRWSEGRYLGVDLLAVLERRELSASGGIATLCALFGADVLLPGDDGTVGMDGLTADSTSHAVGVSDDLRDGLRQSIEILANDVVRTRRQRGDDLSDPDLPQRLARESLRFLYRILFLLYAEARPELNIVPVGAPEYNAGYGLDRLRDLIDQPLTTPREQNGSHVHESLDVLFRLVSGDLRSVASMPVEDLRADLFDRRRTTLIDGDPGAANPPRLRNSALQRVLRLLLMSKPQKGRRRGYISYANLGINQLGAVYEGLMSYTGVLTTQPTVEVARDGDSKKGSWLVPESTIANYREEDLVKVTDPVTGEEKLRRYDAGEFAFRLSGRDRERSASFYTPEVLTRCVVEHSLAELITEQTSAEDILEYRVCEPALGSGAFANEAVNQLADAYLERRQKELDERIPAERLPAERRRVKAWIALHRVYGVDLNATAVELAEVSMWLNVMQPHLAAPWFGLHLKRGNSLIGARRATYDLAALKREKAKWWQTPPDDYPLVANPLGTITGGRIHHFLLPSDTWGAVAGAKQARELAPDEAAGMRAWKRSMLTQPSAADAKRLAALGRRVERLWQIAARRLEISEAEASRDIPVWGHEAAPNRSTVTRERIESALNDPDSMYRRLRFVMDAWCALSFWPLDQVGQLPTWAEWLSTLEALVGLEGTIAKGPQDVLSLDVDFDALEEVEQLERGFHAMASMFEVLADHPWLGEVRTIAEREGFFHWELDFAQVFSRGGFDLQVGNPPWVRPVWKEDLSLAEVEPWFVLKAQIPDQEFRSRRIATLVNRPSLASYLVDLQESAALATVLGGFAEHHLLTGLQSNLYVSFIERIWRSMSSSGVAGLVHPEGHFLDPKGGRFREEVYARLRRHWQFDNARYIFQEVDYWTTFGVHVYGERRAVSFLQAVGLLDVASLEGSFVTKPSAAKPAVKCDDGTWDLRPHPSRIMRVDRQVLAVWAALFDPAGTPASRARLVRPFLREHQQVLETLSIAKRRQTTLGERVSSCWHEKGAKTGGYIEQAKTEASSWDEVILQGPHFNVATPFSKNAREIGFKNSDYDSCDLESLPDRAIPRTNYRRCCPREKYDAGVDQWMGRPSWDYWRTAVRRMTVPGLQRSLVAAIFPPGAAHVHACQREESPDGDSSERTPDPPDMLATALLCGVFCSLPLDYLVKVSGKTDMHPEVIKSLPAPIKHPAWPYLLLRTLRLNCLTRDYEDLWNALAPLTAANDAWTPAFSDWPPLVVPTHGWTMETPLRSDFERRAALVETDALGAVMLGLSAEQLCLIYRVQFGVLRKYEHDMWFDCEGHQIAKDFHAYGVHQEKTDFPTLLDYVAAMEAVGLDAQRDQPSAEVASDPRFADFLDHYEAPFYKADREAEMTAAHAEFTRRLQALGLLTEDGSEAPGAEEVDAQAVLEGRLPFTPADTTAPDVAGGA